MATNQEIIDDAGYELGALEYGQSFDATDSADALTAFNRMMSQWEYDGKDLNWFTQDTLGDTCPIPKWAERGVVSALAIDLGAVFNISPSPSLVVKSDDGQRFIAKVLIDLELEGLNNDHLPQGWPYWGDILNGP